MSEARVKSNQVFQALFAPSLVLRKRLLGFLVLPFYFVLFTFDAHGQETTEIDIAPPPLKRLSKEEKSQLDAQNDLKKRTNLALELMELRLKKAEDLRTREAYDEMFLELGGFHALMDNTFEFLNRNNPNNGKVLNNFKRLEIGLRAFRPRLEVIRLDLPSKYDVYVKNLITFLRDVRTRSIEPLFGDSVVPAKKT